MKRILGIFALVSLSACGTATRPTPSQSPQVTTAPSTSRALTLEEVPNALARAYATGDEAALAEIARVLESAGPEPPPTNGSDRQATRSATLSDNGKRFLVTTATGAYWGSTETGARGFIPGESDRAQALFSGLPLAALYKPPPVPSDQNRIEWEKTEDQPRTTFLDLKHRRVMARPLGRIVKVTPDQRAVLMTAGAETGLLMLRLDTWQRTVLGFDVSKAMEAQPGLWTPTRCTRRCAPGAPEPWNITRNDVRFSGNGALVAVHWGGRLRGRAQGVTVHDTKSGKLVASLATSADPSIATSHDGKTLAVVVEREKAKSGVDGPGRFFILDAERHSVVVAKGCPFPENIALPPAFSEDDAHVGVAWPSRRDTSKRDACLFDRRTGRAMSKAELPQTRREAVVASMWGAPGVMTLFANAAAVDRVTCTRRGFVLPKKLCNPR